MYGNRGPSGPREMFDAKCSDCGQDTQVPFKPTEGRPVYCRDCFQKHRPPRDSFGGGGGRGGGGGYGGGGGRGGGGYGGGGGGRRY